MDNCLQELFSQSLENGLYQDDIRTFVSRKVDVKYNKKPVNIRYVLFSISLIVLLFALGTPKSAFKRPLDYVQQYMSEFYSHESNCLLQHNGVTIEATRPMENCDMCKDVHEIPVVYNMTREYFLKNHAYTNVPVLIKQGTGNWTALRVFGWRYFRKLYAKLKAFKDNEELGCQFFPYKTNFASLKQVFRISKERANLQEDQWYVGWSNCVPRVAKILRYHYQRPEFLPGDSESSALDWIFMGGTGTGAMMHIDSVNRPSWQAQVKGTKTWYLEPPPECESVCPKGLQATMEPGDIIVVDTNKWYHSTHVHPGNMSVTIGSEYD